MDRRLPQGATVFFVGASQNTTIIGPLPAEPGHFVHPSPRGSRVGMQKLQPAVAEGSGTNLAASMTSLGGFIGTVTFCWRPHQLGMGSRTGWRRVTYLVLFLSSVPPTEASTVASRGDECREHQWTTGSFVLGNRVSNDGVESRDWQS